MRKSTCAGLALVAAGATLAFSPAGDRVAQAVMGPPDGVPGAPDFTVQARVPSSAGESAPPQPPVPSFAPEPALSRAQTDAAARAVSADASLARLSGGTPYRVVEAIPWTEPGTADVVGAELKIEFSSPVSGAVTLPGTRFDDAAKAYQRHEYRVTVTGIKTVSALVDFRDGNRVVDIAPGEEGTTEELPGNAHFQSRDGGD